MLDYIPALCIYPFRLYPDGFSAFLIIRHTCISGCFLNPFICPLGYLPVHFVGHLITLPSYAAPLNIVESSQTSTFTPLNPQTENPMQSAVVALSTMHRKIQDR